MARMATKLVSARMMVRNAATALDHAHPDHVTLCCMAKLHATETCFEVSPRFLRDIGKVFLSFTPTQTKTKIHAVHVDSLVPYLFYVS